MMRACCAVLLLALAGTAAAQSADRNVFVAPAQPVAGEARHALVIGNGAYASGPLRNPVNDARAMAQSLGDAGFQVLLVENGSQSAMQRAVRAFGDRIANGGVGLFYYAGHGIQARGRNYLIPVNADIAREDEIEFEALDVNLVLAKMDSAKNGLNIVILDACRNNPFQRAWRSATSGLAQIDAPTGTFIAFATAPGSVAADGLGDNGVYTKYLLSEMEIPGLPIEQVFKQVRNGVMSETKGRQIPWESSSLRGEFAFRPGVQPSVAEAVAAALKREREAQQAELQRLQAALERQQKQLEAVGLKPSSAPAPVAATPAKPAVMASVAPVLSASPSGSRVPRVGDSWTYRLSEPRRAEGRKQREYVVKVAAVTQNAILDQYTIEQEKPGEWAHAAGGYIVGQGRSLFAPYLFSIGNTREQGAISVEMLDPACSGGFGYICEASARVAGHETVKVPAGSFETIKVVVEQSWRPISLMGMQFAAQQNGGRRLTVWYAPAAKRAVKFSSRTTYGSIPPIETDFDLELTSYQLKP